MAALVCAWLAGAIPAPAAPQPPVWRIHAIRYATIPKFRVASLVTGADTTRTLDIAMMFWLLEGPGDRRVLVDAGFYRPKFVTSWKPADYVKPSDALETLGVSPRSIDDIIISHVHWDHLDGADLFPKARVWIQSEEYDYYVGAGGVPAHPGIDSLDAAMLAGLMKAGRVKRVAGDAQEILPGITAYTGGKHTFASQYVSVRIGKGTAVIASDNLYLYENLERHRPIAQTLDSTSNLAAQERMKKIASDPRLIVPVQHTAVLQRVRFRHARAVRIE